MKFDWHQEYGVDTTKEISDYFIKVNYRATLNVIQNPKNFPKANFEYVQDHHNFCKLEMFIRGLTD